MILIFPRMVYRGPAVHMLVDDAEGFDAARADGWFASVPEAAAGQHDDPVPLVTEQASPDDDAPPTRAELEQKAEELGIKIDGRWSDKRVADAIAAKLRG